MKRVVVLAVAALACGKTETPVGDAAVERPTTDMARRWSDLPPALTVDFAVEDCPSFDADSDVCTGRVPLALRFVPMVTTTVSQYFWDFGGAFDFSGTPSHTFDQPGQYTVKLVVTGLDGTVVSKTHTQMVQVTADEIGDPCAQKGQCGDPLSCLCPPATAPCAFGPPSGMCVASCPSGSCADGQVCAGLATAGTTNGDREAWQTSLCLRRCSEDTDCSDGVRCRLLPPGPAGTGWVHGCFGNFPADAGQSCLDSTNSLRDDLCATGICADLGAKGICTMACSTQACPPGTDCAVLGDGRKLCLRRCDVDFTCSDDPLLGCVEPGAGDLGYNLIDADAGDGAAYCAPKPCGSDDDCLPSGRCDSPGGDGNGHCVARSD